MKLAIPVFVWVLVAPVLKTSGIYCSVRESDLKCIANYYHFEESFINLTENRYKLYKVFYSPNGHLPYALEVVYQAVLPNGTECDILTEGSNYQNIYWIWVSSPLFLYCRPMYLNRLIFDALNYFRGWTTPNLSLKVYYPCPNMTFEFLLQMTASLQNYALGDVMKKSHKANVLGKSVQDNSFFILPYSPSDSRSQKVHANYFVAEIVFACLGILEITLVCLGAVGLLKWTLSYYVEKTYQYTYNYYGLMCGATVMATVSTGLIVYGHSSNAKQLFPSNAHDRKEFISYIVAIPFCFFSGIPIAMYFAFRNKPPAIPYIIMLPVALVFCCCNTQRTKSLLFGIGLWIMILATQALIITGTIVLLIILVEPFAIITSILVIVLVLFCLTNILGLIFTISAYIFTPRQQRPPGGKTTMYFAVILILIMMIVCCFCAAFGISGYVTNMDTTEGTFQSLARSAIGPLFVGAVTFGLQKMMVVLLERPQKDPQYVNIDNWDSAQITHPQEQKDGLGRKKSAELIMQASIN